METPRHPPRRAGILHRRADSARQFHLHRIQIRNRDRRRRIPRALRHCIHPHLFLDDSIPRADSTPKTRLHPDHEPDRHLRHWTPLDRFLPNLLSRRSFPRPAFLPRRPSQHHHPQRGRLERQLPLRLRIHRRDRALSRRIDAILARRRERLHQRILHNRLDDLRPDRQGTGRSQRLSLPGHSRRGRFLQTPARHPETTRLPHGGNRRPLLRGRAQGQPRGRIRHRQRAILRESLARRAPADSRQFAVGILHSNRRRTNQPAPASYFLHRGYGQSLRAGQQPLRPHHRPGAAGTDHRPAARIGQAAFHLLPLHEHPRTALRLGRSILRARIARPRRRMGRGKIQGIDSQLRRSRPADLRLPRRLRQTGR